MSGRLLVAEQLVLLKALLIFEARLSTVAAAFSSYYSYKSIVIGQAASRPYLAVESRIDTSGAYTNVVPQINDNGCLAPTLIAKIKNVGTIAIENLRSQTYTVSIDGAVKVGKNTLEATTANSISRDTELTMIDDLIFKGIQSHFTSTSNSNQTFLSGKSQGNSKTYR